MIAVRACCLPLILLIMNQVQLSASAISPAGSPVEDVQLQFYMLQVEQWREQGLEAKFKPAMAKALTSFCIANYNVCGFNSSDIANFTASSVRITPGYPTNVDSHYLSLRLAITYSLPPGDIAGDSIRSFNLPATDTTSILEKHRMNLYDAIGYYIVYIDSRFFSIPPPHLLNLIVVSAAGGFTLLLIITALTLRSCDPDVPTKRKVERRMKSLTNGHSLAGLTTDTVAAAAAAAAVAAAAASAIDKTVAADESESSITNGAILNPGFRNSLSEEPDENRASTIDCAAEQIVLTEVGSCPGDATQDNNNEGEADCADSK